MWSDARHASIVRSALYAQTTTETRGETSSRGGNDAPYCPCTDQNAGFRSRRASTSPKAQSLISEPPVNHSSVHEKTNVPATPDSNAARIIHASMSPCPWAPSRIESTPNSVSTSGLSSDRFCRRER